jgi:hypothetical protein
MMMSPPPANRLQTSVPHETQDSAAATFGSAGPLLTEVETAQLLGVSPRTLQNWRRTGRGPVHVRLGGLVRYAPADVEAFIAASRRGTAANSDTPQTDPLQADAAAQPEEPGLNLVVRAMERAAKSDEA